MIQSLDKKSPWTWWCHNRMLKLSFQSVMKLWLMILCNCLNFGTFPENWKKDSVGPIHKKIANNLSITTVLYLCSLSAPKFLKKVMSGPIFELIIENNLLNSTQSGFKPNNSRGNQLISITHCILVHLTLIFHQRFAVSS